MFNILPKPAGKEKVGVNGVSLCSPLSLWSKPFFLRSVITGLVPGFPFRVELVHINLEVLKESPDWLGGFHPGISTGSHWIMMSRPSTANLCWTGLLVEVVVVRTSFLALEYIGQSERRMCRL